MRFIENYTIRQVTDLAVMDRVTAEFIIDAADELCAQHEGRFNWADMDLEGYAKQGLFLVAVRDQKPVGMFLGRISRSLFDRTVTIMLQDILYVRPGNPGAAWALMQHFIAIGRENADHIFTMITKHTQIKRRSLERLGFQKVEELYRMEF